MRSRLIALAAALLATASPAAAQWCDCGGPGIVPTEASAFVPVTRYRRETVLVPRTRLVPRTVYVAHTRLVPRTLYISRSDYGAGGYPAGYRYGSATYVPPGISYPCLMGTVGCDSSAVGSLDY